MSPYLPTYHSNGLTSTCLCKSNVITYWCNIKGKVTCTICVYLDYKTVKLKYNAMEHGAICSGLDCTISTSGFNFIFIVRP